MRAIGVSHTQVEKMSFDEIFHLTAGWSVFSFFIIYLRVQQFYIIFVSWDTLHTWSSPEKKKYINNNNNNNTVVGPL